MIQQQLRILARFHLFRPARALPIEFERAFLQAKALVESRDVAVGELESPWIPSLAGVGVYHLKSSLIVIESICVVTQKIVNVSDVVEARDFACKVSLPAIDLQGFLVMLQGLGIIAEGVVSAPDVVEIGAEVRVFVQGLPQRDRLLHIADCGFVVPE